MIRTPEERLTCNRCGKCCEDVHLAHGPKKMEELKQANSPDTELGKIARMLVWVNQYHVNIPGWRHNVHHYRCIHFSKDEEGKGVCGIHDTRPNMCKDYPYYTDLKYSFHPTNGKKEGTPEFFAVIAEWPYPAQYEGCSYNMDDRKPSILTGNVKDFKPE